MFARTGASQTLLIGETLSETRVFPTGFKSRGGTGGDRGSKARINEPPRSGVPVQQLVDFVDKLGAVLENRPILFW